MILRITFEEIRAVNSAAERILGGPGSVRVAAPPEAMVGLEPFLPLDGDISVSTLGEQGRLLRAVDAVVQHLKRRMDTIIVEQYVGADDAVNAYFDYANVVALRDRLMGIGEEMEALLEVMVGDPPAVADADEITFPD